MLVISLHNAVNWFTSGQARSCLTDS